MHLKNRPYSMILSIWTRGNSTSENKDSTTPTTRTTSLKAITLSNKPIIPCNTTCRWAATTLKWCRCTCLIKLTSSNSNKTNSIIYTPPLNNTRKITINKDRVRTIPPPKKPLRCKEERNESIKKNIYHI